MNTELLLIITTQMGSEASQLDRYKQILYNTPTARITRLEEHIIDLEARIKHLEDLLTPPSYSMKTALDHRHSYPYQVDDTTPILTDI